MALVRGNFPFGDVEIEFGSTGGTFGNLWPNGEAKVDGVLAGGGDMDVAVSKYITAVDIAIGGGGGVDVTFIQVFRYFGSPVKVEPVLAVGPSQATLQKAFTT